MPETIRVKTPAVSSVPSAITNLVLSANFETVMFSFNPVDDIDLDSYSYQLYSDSSGTTLVSEGKNKANVFTISVTNSSDGVTKTYYGRVAVVNSAGTVGTYTSLVPSGATPLIGEQYINSLTAAKITAGTIGAHTVTLGGATSIIKSSNYNFASPSTTSGWYIRGDGHFSLGGANGITYDNATVVIGSAVQVNANLAADSISVGSTNKLNINDGIGSGVGGMTVGNPSYNYWYANGNFRVGGSLNYMEWNGNTLSIVGQIASTSGTIGGWKINNSSIQSANDKVTLNSNGLFEIGTVATDKTTIASNGDITVYGASSGGDGVTRMYGAFLNVKKGTNPDAVITNTQITFDSIGFFKQADPGNPNYGIYIAGGNNGGNAFIDIGATGVTDNNSISCSGWFRSTGVSGWHNQTYGGGIYMADATWIRTYGSKNLYVDAQIRVDGGQNIQEYGIAQGGIYIQQGIGIDSNQVEATGTLYLNATGGGVRVNGTGTTGYGLTVNGSAAKSSGGTAWATFSDFNLKKDITEYEKGLSEILKLRPVYFKYNGKAGTVLNEDNVGLIAQEVQVIFPKAVEEFEYSPDTKPVEGVVMEKYLSFSFNEVQYALINAVKELSAKVDELQSRLV